MNPPSPAGDYASAAPPRNAVWPQLGQFERGVTAALFGAVLGGVGTIAAVLWWMKLFPSLRKVERLE